MKEKIMTAAAALYFGLIPTAEAAGRAELLVGQESSTLDVAVAEPIGPLKMISRTRATTDYPEASTVNLTALTYPLGNGLSLAVRSDYVNGQLTPRVGGRFVGKFGDVSTVAMPMTSLDGNIDVMARVEYRPTILDRIRAVFGLETVTNFTGKNHKFSTQRARVGFNYDNKECGFAADVVQKGGKYVGTNIGGSCRMMW